MCWSYNPASVSPRTESRPAAPPASMKAASPANRFPWTRPPEPTCWPADQFNRLGGNPGTTGGRASALGADHRLGVSGHALQPRIIRAADKFFAFYTPVILVLSVLAWIVTKDPVRMVTMWVVGCPCAMLLASPLAIVVSLARGSRSGIQVKAGPFVEASANLQTVVFDKTGTLTSGKFVVSGVRPVEGVTPAELLRRGGDHRTAQQPSPRPEPGRIRGPSRRLSPGRRRIFRSSRAWASRRWLTGKWPWRVPPRSCRRNSPHSLHAWIMPMNRCRWCRSMCCSKAGCWGRFT